MRIIGYIVAGVFLGLFVLITAVYLLTYRKHYWEKATAAYGPWWR